MSGPSGPPPPPAPRSPDTLPPPWIQLVETEFGAQLKCFFCAKLVSEDHLRNKKHLQCEQKPSHNGWKNVYMQSMYGHDESLYDVGREVTLADLRLLPGGANVLNSPVHPTYHGTNSAASSSYNPGMSPEEEQHLDELALLQRLQVQEEARLKQDQFQEELLKMAQTPKQQPSLLPQLHPQQLLHLHPHQAQLQERMRQQQLQQQMQQRAPLNLQQLQEQKEQLQRQLQEHHLLQQQLPVIEPIQPLHLFQQPPARQQQHQPTTTTAAPLIQPLHAGGPHLPPAPPPPQRTPSGHSHVLQQPPQLQPPVYEQYPCAPRRPGC